MGPSNSTVVVIFGGMSKWKDNGILPTVAHLTVIDAGMKMCVYVCSVCVVYACMCVVCV